MMVSDGGLEKEKRRRQRRDGWQWKSFGKARLFIKSYELFFLILAHINISNNNSDDPRHEEKKIVREEHAGD